MLLLLLGGIWNALTCLPPVPVKAGIIEKAGKSIYGNVNGYDGNAGY